MVIYTPGRALRFVRSRKRPQRPIKPDPTDAERIELFKTMYGYGGTYKVDGNKLVTTPWIQAWTGTDRPPTVVEIKDKQLTATSSPFKSTIDGQEIVVTTTW
jgi:hypothetical protein